MKVEKPADITLPEANWFSEEDPEHTWLLIPGAADTDMRDDKEDEISTSLFSSSLHETASPESLH